MIKRKRKGKKRIPNLSGQPEKMSDGVLDKWIEFLLAGEGEWYGEERRQIALEAALREKAGRA